MKNNNWQDENDSIKIKFDYHELPSAYLSANPNADELRKQLITNQVGTCSDGNLENVFFSNDNIDIINRKLIFTIYNITEKKYKIAKQTPESLTIVMRYVFINYAKHLPFSIKEQVDELNNLVLKEIVPNIITNITQKVNYISYINERPPLLDLPISTNKTKTLIPYL
jgi:hypothetical protein